MSITSAYDPFPSLTSCNHGERLKAREIRDSLRKPVHCGRWSVRGTTPEKHFYSRVNCKCWDCQRCGPRRAAHYKHVIGAEAERNKLQRFLTLTLDPKNTIGDPGDHGTYLLHLEAGVKCECDVCSRVKRCSVDYIRSSWAMLRKYMARALGSMPQFIAVVEFQQSTGLAHLHVLLGAYVDFEWIRDAWLRCGGGSHVNIKFVDVHRVSRYMSKYLTKDLLLSAPKKSRRVTCSRGIHLNRKREKGDVRWELLRVPLKELYRRWEHSAIEVSYDTDGKTMQGFVLLV